MFAWGVPSLGCQGAKQSVVHTSKTVWCRHTCSQAAAAAQVSMVTATAQRQQQRRQNVEREFWVQKAAPVTHLRSCSHTHPSTPHPRSRSGLALHALPSPPAERSPERQSKARTGSMKTAPGSVSGRLFNRKEACMMMLMCKLQLTDESRAGDGFCVSNGFPGGCI